MADPLDVEAPQDGTLHQAPIRELSEKELAAISGGPEVENQPTPPP